MVVVEMTGVIVTTTKTEKIGTLGMAGGIVGWETKIFNRSGWGKNTFENADGENDVGVEITSGNADLKRERRFHGRKSDGGKRRRAGELKGGGCGSFFEGMFF
jgi:hypothetical protein